MTDQHELDRVLGAFFADGPEQLPDRVLEAALDEIGHTRQRHTMGVPRRLRAMPMLARVAAAAVIGLLAVGGTLYLTRPGTPTVGVTGPSPAPTAAPSVPARTSAPTPVPTPTPAPTLRIGLTGSIGAGRQIQTQTRLADGRVLVTGGFDVNDLPLATATLFDPKTGTFSPTGSMAAARGYDTATLLNDGRVLITGGGPASWVRPGAFLASAELYDPKTGTFSPTGSMSTPREDHTATLLADGRVLVVGGDDTTSPSHGVASAELYDPKTGSFSPTGSMAGPRGFHTATLLADGRVLVTGGDIAAWTPDGDLASAEVYDPKTGKFSPTGSMSTVRCFHLATLLADGRVLITGGTDGSNDLVSAELYNPKTGAFSPAGQMTVGRIYQSATRLADGRVLVAGGGGDYTNYNFLASAELFDPKTGTFAPTGSMVEARTYHGATLLADGRVLVTGGYGHAAPLASAEIYDPKTGTFSPIP